MFMIVKYFIALFGLIVLSNASFAYGESEARVTTAVDAEIQSTAFNLFTSTKNAFEETEEAEETTTSLLRSVQHRSKLDNEFMLALDQMLSILNLGTGRDDRPPEVEAFYTCVEAKAKGSNTYCGSLQKQVNAIAKCLKKAKQYQEEIRQEACNSAQAIPAECNIVPSFCKKTSVVTAS